MAFSKKKVIVYTDWIEQFKDLTDEEAGKLIKHFFEYVNDLNPVSDRFTELLFNPIKSTLKRDLKAWECKQQTNKENGLKGGRPKSKLETQNNQKNPVGFSETQKNPVGFSETQKNPVGFSETQNNPKKGVNDNVSVNVNVKKDNIDERKSRFAETIKPFIEFYGKEVCREFYLYWTEPNIAGTKLSFEMQKTWDIKRRLKRWVDNDFSKNKKETLKPNTYIPQNDLN